MVEGERDQAGTDVLFPGQLGFLAERRTGRLLVALGAAAVLLFLLMIFTSREEDWWAVLLFGLLFLASEYFSLSLDGNQSISLAILPVVCIVMISGPIGAFLVPLFGLPVYYLNRGEEGLPRVFFNALQFMVAAGAAGWLFHHVGGEVMKVYPSNAGNLVFPWAVCVLVFYLLNTGLVALTVEGGSSYLKTWYSRYLRLLPSYILFGGIGFLSTFLYIRLEFPAVLMLFVPLLAIRVIAAHQREMLDVCDETTMAVMEAMESQEGFSKSHARGVADIAMEIAEEMGLAEREIHWVRQAALLHDTGKLEMSQDLLRKGGMLTREEYEEIMKHPLLAGTIVKREESFAPVAPIIRHHHETIDGLGYVDGLSGDTIPLGARILAVADTFDAMQRPTYDREEFSAEYAVAEIIRCKGIQFDPKVVDAFVRVARRRGIWRVPEQVVEEGGEEEVEAEVEQPALLEQKASVETSADVATRRGERVPEKGEERKVSDVIEDMEKEIRGIKDEETDRRERGTLFKGYGLGKRGKHSKGGRVGRRTRGEDEGAPGGSTGGEGSRDRGEEPDSGGGGEPGAPHKE